MKTLINKYRLFVVAAVVVMVFFSLFQINKLTIDTGFEQYIPGEVGNRAYLRKLDTIFGGSEKIMLIMVNDSTILNRKSYQRISSLTNELENLEGVERCLSIRDIIDIKLSDGIASIEPIIETIPTDSRKLDTLKQIILNSNLGRRFIASDFTATAIILSKSNDIGDNEIISSIEKVIENNPGREKIFIGGLAYIRSSINSYIVKDLTTLLPLALLFMVLMLYFSFKEWKGVLLPFIIVVLSILFSFGFMALMGWEISLITVLLPIMLIAIANDYGIHLINLYQEKYRIGAFTNMKEVAVDIYNELKRPIFITALTTIGGLLGLLSHKLPPAAELGVITSVGIGLALLMSLFLLPVLLSFYRMPKTRVKSKTEKSSFLNSILALFSNWATVHPKRVLASFLTIAVLSAIGLFFLKIDTNTEDYFMDKSNIKQGIELINEKFGGSQYVSILFNGDVLSPKALQRMEKYTEAIEKLPEAGYIISPTMFLKELSKGVYLPNEPQYKKLPATKAEAIQTLEIFAMSGYEEQISQFIDYNYENTRILVSLKDGSNATGKALLKSLREITNGDPQLVCIAGPGLSKIQIADMVIHGQISSILLAFGIVFILLSLIFKSVVAGVQSSLPLVLSTLLLFGLMGFLGIPLDIVNTLLSSIMIGVGVDYTIHFLWRYKTEYGKTLNSKLAISNTLSSVGRGIIFNAFSVMVGFSALIFSSFAPLRFFGELVIISIFACLVSALLLIPAIITIAKPRFLEPQKIDTI